MRRPRQGGFRNAQTTPLFVLSALAASLAGGQPNENVVDRVLTLNHVDGPQNFQEVMNAIRVMTGLAPVASDFRLKTAELRGTAEQIGLAEWVCSAIDAPQAGGSQYQLAGDKVARVFYFSHVNTPKGLQELINVVRAIADVNRIMPYNAARAVVVRGNGDQMRLTEWLVQELDGSPNGRPALQSVREYRLQGNGNEAVRVFYPATLQGPTDL